MFQYFGKYTFRLIGALHVKWPLRSGRIGRHAHRIVSEYPRLSAWASVSPTVSRRGPLRQSVRTTWPRSLVPRMLAPPGGSNALVAHFPYEDHDIRVSILRMSREVAVFCCVRMLSPTITNRDDLHRTVLLEPLFDLINGLGEPADEGGVGHCGCPLLAPARPAAVERR
jgi:hypothetical protein